MIPSNGEMPVDDGLFFSTGQEFNQGVFFTWDENIAISAMETAADKASSTNLNGLNLGKSMTYSKTADEIISAFS